MFGVLWFTVRAWIVINSKNRKASISLDYMPARLWGILGWQVGVLIFDTPTHWAGGKTTESWSDKCHLTEFKWYKAEGSWNFRLSCMIADMLISIIHTGRSQNFYLSYNRRLPSCQVDKWNFSTLISQMWESYFLMKSWCFLHGLTFSPSIVQKRKIFRI